MKMLLVIARYIWMREWWSLLRGAILALTVLLAGAGLLGLSGWFITATGVAGLAGVGIAFDVFRPSAGVRFLAFGRTAARYGERILTHDATLRSLATLRVELFSSMARLPFEKASSLRASVHLNRLTADVDALDGLALRFVIPLLAGGAALLMTATAVGLLFDFRAGFWVLIGFVPLTIAALVLVVAKSVRPNRSAQIAENAFRMRIIDLMAGRVELIAAGKLQDQCDNALAADEKARSLLAISDRHERNGDFVIALAETVIGTGMLALGAYLVSTGQSGPALAAFSFFAVIALGETVGPLRRGFSEIGRMVDAARRISPFLSSGENPARSGVFAMSAVRAPQISPLLVMRNLSFYLDGANRPLIEKLDLEVRAGETVALVGASGAGKSTLLHLAAGLLKPGEGTVMVEGRVLGEWSEGDFRGATAMLPQRSALLSGSIMDALALGRDDLSEDEARAVLKVVQLDEVIAARGGLESRLGEAGKGLSGGEARRLALARVLLRRPRLLLLDEPTEGLDDKTATRVLDGIREWLPEAGILIASHRDSEKRVADRRIEIQCANKA